MSSPTVRPWGRAFRGRLEEHILDSSVLRGNPLGDPSGRPIFFQPGSPNTRIMGKLWHPAAQAAGVRLISVSRPGYGGSTPLPGVSIAALADALQDFLQQIGNRITPVPSAHHGCVADEQDGVADPSFFRQIRSPG